MNRVCAIYTRKSSEEGLEQGFNSLDAQREACAAFILSQKAQGWKASRAVYDDGGYSGGTLHRPALQQLLADLAAGRVQIVVVYKVDRLTRSLADFAKLVELFDAQGVSFVSVTQQFNTTSSMGRLTLNVLLSFAQFEREVTGERIRDKIAASKRKGMWMGGIPPIGYRAQERTLAIDEDQAERVRAMYRRYLVLGCVSRLQAELVALGWRTPPRQTKKPGATGDRPFSRGHLYRILGNPVYAGRIVHKGQVFEGNHPAIVEDVLWNEVQAQLQAHRQGQRSRSNAKEVSLLAGVVFDEQGRRLTPSHATKGTKRYRYYVGTEGDEPLRIPAPELERAAVEALVGFLNDEGQVLDALDEPDAQQVQQALREAKERAIALGQAASRVVTVQALVDRIAIGTSRLQITVKAQAIGGSRKVAIEVPVQLQRSGMAMRLIVRNGPTPAAPTIDPKLVALIAKAQDWFASLASGRCRGVGEIAANHDVTTSYVMRVMPLAFLAPDIVEAIVAGKGPSGLTAERLRRMGALPMAWEAQRAMFGID